MILFCPKSACATKQVDEKRDIKRPSPKLTLTHTSQHQTSDMESKILLFFTALAAVSAVAWGVPGGKTAISAEDLTSDTIVGLKPHAIGAIKQQKEAQNSLAHCVDLDGEIISGTTQVVAGTNYDLVVKVTPKKSSSDDCAAQNIDVTNIPIEHCNVNLWHKLNDEKVVTVESCVQQ